MTKISLMQGRLLPPFEGRFQAFPAHDWEKEFEYAEKLGFFSIEWIYEKPHEMSNPLYSKEGIEALQKLIRKTGIQVKSVCADYYMTEKLISHGRPVEEHWRHLSNLLERVKRLGISYVVLPFVDQSSLQDELDREVLAEKLKTFLSSVGTLGIEIHLEADLKPRDFRDLLEYVRHPLLKMNYDTGNSASLGYDVDEEMTLMGSYLGSVHIKDRLLKGSTVPLGTGNVDFSKCFSWFRRLNFDGWFVLQAARGDSGQEIETVRDQQKFVIDGVIHA
jgi:hexulose-6-phosphate isomerase